MTATVPKTSSAQSRMSRSSDILQHDQSARCNLSRDSVCWRTACCSKPEGGPVPKRARASAGCGTCGSGVPVYALANRVFSLCVVAAETRSAASAVYACQAAPCGTWPTSCASTFPVRTLTGKSLPSYLQLLKLDECLNPRCTRPCRWCPFAAAGSTPGATAE